MRHARRWRWAILAVLLLGLANIGPERLSAAVTLSWFKATPQEDHILIEWETATEINTLGFYIQRATGANGPFTEASRINPVLIPAESLEDGDFLQPHQYEYRDVTAMPGVTYYYVLEEIDTSGSSHLYTEFKDRASFGTPPPTATMTPSPTPTRVVTATPSRTPRPTSTPTRTSPSPALPSPTHTLVTLGGPTVTQPPPPPTDTRPAPTRAPATVQPTATSRPPAPTSTRPKPTLPPMRRPAATSTPAPTRVTAATIAPAPPSPTGLQPVSTAAQAATVLTPPAQTAAATLVPTQAAPGTFRPTPQATAPQPEILTPQATLQAPGMQALSVAWRLGGALLVGILGLALVRLLRPTG